MCCDAYCAWIAVNSNVLFLLVINVKGNTRVPSLNSLVGRGDSCYRNRLRNKLLFFAVGFLFYFTRTRINFT